MTDLADASLRLDKWLWHARIFKTRALAARVISGKGARVTRAGRTERTDKPSFGIRPGDTVAISKEREIRVLEVVALGERRGPAPEAQGLYIDHSAITRPDGPSPDEGTSDAR